jgi:hypothetical protein
MGPIRSPRYGLAYAPSLTCHVARADERFEGAEPVPKPLRGLREVLSGLDTRLHPLVVDHWARTPDLDLVVDGEPMAPVQWLRTGGDPGRLSELLPQP